MFLWHKKFHHKVFFTICFNLNLFSVQKNVIPKLLFKHFFCSDKKYFITKCSSLNTKLNLKYYFDIKNFFINKNFQTKLFFITKFSLSHFFFVFFLSLKKKSLIMFTTVTSVTTFTTVLTVTRIYRFGTFHKWRQPFMYQLFAHAALISTLVEPNRSMLDFVIAQWQMGKRPRQSVSIS